MSGSAPSIRSGSPSVGVKTAYDGWWNGAGTSRRPVVVAIVAARGDVEVIDEVRAATAPPA